jgi:hypothetical protein
VGPFEESVRVGSFVLVSRSPAELLARLAQRPSEFRQLLAPEHEQHDGENDEKFGDAHVHELSIALY